MGKYFKNCHITTVGTHPSWTNSQLNNWITLGGGTFASGRGATQTTHLVVQAEAWKKQAPIVRLALAAIHNRKSSVKIVSFDWLEDCLWSKAKKRETPYLWEKLDPMSMRQTKTSQTNGQESEVRGPKNHSGMLTEVFYDSTDGYLGEREKKNIEKQRDLALLAEEEIEAEERAEKEKEKRKAAEAHAASFKRGAKKARNEIFSENHHIYTDETNFKYDVLLTKVDTRNNCNERWALTLQLYESNSEPHTYAMNAQFAGTRTKATNNVLVSIGSNFPTAFRAFKKAFKEKTNVDWDARVSHALERNKQKLLERERVVELEFAKANGTPVVDAAATTKPSEEDFATMPFSYYPPGYGSLGVLPDRGRFAAGSAGAINSEDPSHPREKEATEEFMMSGANGDGSEDSRTMTYPSDAMDTDFNVNDEEPLTPTDRAYREQECGTNLNSGWETFENSHFEDPFFANHTSATQYDAVMDGLESPLFGANPSEFDSWNFGTQDAGETQIAENARDSMEAFMDRQDQIEED